MSWICATIVVASAAAPVASSAGAVSAGTSVSAGTYYVDVNSTAGPCSDAYPASLALSSTTPWCTIGKAVASVPSGATIAVAPGRYDEEVVLTPKDNGVTLEGVGSQMPVIDGEGARSIGIDLVSAVHNVTIMGFEIRNLVAPTTAGFAAGILGEDTYDDTIDGNYVHDIHSPGLWSYGIDLGTNQTAGLVHDITISHNRIADVGPGGESRGIWLVYTKNMTVDGNEVYRVRCEGIRDWVGLDNTIINNRVYLNWAGITLESSVGDYVANNVAYDDVWGFIPKHVSNPTSLAIWGLSAGQWSRFWHNTAYGNTHAAVGVAMNSPDADYIDVRDNIFANSGDVDVHDFPSARGSNIIFDGNVYSASVPVYYTTWSAPRPNTFTTLSALQSALSWEPSGQSADVVFANPEAGNFAYTTGLRPGVTLPDSFGAQLGAAHVPPASMSWARYPATVIASTPVPLYVKPQAASDGRDDTFWESSNYNTNATITFDLGSAEPMNTFVLDLFSHMDPRSPRDYSIQVSNDNVTYTTVIAGTNPDSEGSSYKYTLASPVTARYVRLNILDNFGGTTITFSDFGIGLLTSPTAGTLTTGFPVPGTPPTSSSVSAHGAPGNVTPSVRHQSQSGGAFSVSGHVSRARPRRRPAAAHPRRRAAKRAHVGRVGRRSQQRSRSSRR